MRALILLLSVATAPALALPPVTEAEAEAFVRSGNCSMGREPGTGITRADGFGWVMTKNPGRHRFFAVGGRLKVKQPDARDYTWMGTVSMTPGLPVAIQLVPPTAKPWQCMDVRDAGRDECGPVPTAFLYDAALAADRR